MDWATIKATATSIAAGITNTRSGWSRGTCPFCLHRVGRIDRRASLAFYIPYGYFRCFRCGIKILLSDWKPQDVKNFDNTVFFSEKAPDWFVPLYGGAENSIIFSRATEYAENRGYDLALRTVIGIGACCSGKFNTRIVIPHKDLRGAWWGFTARNWLGKCEDPYRYPDGMDRSRMFNAQILDIPTDDPALVMEGVCDGILYWPDPVTCGGKPTSDQLKVFRATRRPLALVLDGDAWAEGWRFAMLLRLHGIHAGAVRLPPGRDPNDRHFVDVDDVRRASYECLTTRGPVEIKEKKKREQVFYG